MKLINRSFVVERGASAVQNLEALRSYRDYLQQARQRNADSRLSAAHQRDLLFHARMATNHTRALATSTLQLALHSMLAGVVDSTIAAWIRASEDNGKVEITDVWNHLFESGLSRDALTGIGLSSESIAGIDSTIRANVGLNLIVVDSGLAVESVRTGRVIRIEHGSAGRPNNVLQLMNRNQLEAITAALEGGQALGADLALVHSNHSARSGETVRLSDLVRDIALLANSEMTRHVRTLNDTGMARHEGRGPGAIWIVIAALIIVGFLLPLTCGSEDAEVEGESGTCIVGTVLILLGIIGGIGQLCDPDSLDPKCRTTPNTAVERA